MVRVILPAVVAGLGGLGVWLLLHLVLVRGGARVLLVGLDGAEWMILGPMMEAGQLPNLKGLVDRGTSGPLKSLEPMISPPIWTSIATGKTPERHGITWFLCDTQRPGQRLPVTSALRRVKALWNILSENKRSVAVVGWWATYPAERVRGYLVSDFVGYHGFGNSGRSVEMDLGKTYPPSFLERIRAKLPAPERLSHAKVRRFLQIGEEEYDAARRGEGPWAGSVSLFCSYLSTADSYVEIAEEAVAGRSADLLAVYSELPDATCHLFARFAPPKRQTVGEEGFARFSQTVEEVYRYQDELLGRLLRASGPEAAVFVVSDHGFRWGDRRPEEGDTVEVGRAHLWHEPEGVFVAAGPGIRRGYRLQRASVLDVTPTLLRYLGLPLARDMDGSPLVDVMEPDWSERNPPLSVESYESRGEDRDTPGPGAAGAAEAFAEEQQRRLAGLGYLSRDGASAEMRAARVGLLLKSGRLGEAEEELRALVRQVPADVGVRLALGDLYRQTGRIPLARKEYEAAVSVAPENPVPLLSLGETLIDLGDVQAAERCLRSATQKAEGFSEAHLALGHVLNLQGRPEEAREEFERTLALDGRSFRALYNLGVLAERAEQREEAETFYRRAIEAAPDEPLPRMNLGVLLANRGSRREALEALSEAARLAPENAEVRYNLGATYLEEGLADKAVEELQVAVRAEPDLRLAHVCLGRAHLAAGRPLEAVSPFETAARLDPKDPEVPFTLAVVEAGLGRTERARPWLDMALSLGGARLAERARRDSRLAGLCETGHSK